MSEETDTPEEVDPAKAASGDEEVIETEASNDVPSLKRVIGAMLFGCKEPLSARQIRNALQRTAGTYGGGAEAYGELKDGEIKKAIAALQDELMELDAGVHIAEVANGYRLQNDASCGIWLRELLGRGKPNRLSKPALETLAIIAYRQPCTRSEIEAVRGVAVDAMVRNLLELQLVKVVGRSELPGKPWLFGTTQAFLEHFGLNKIDDLPGVEELKRREMVLHQAVEEAEAEEGETEEEGEAEAPARAESEEPEPEGEANPEAESEEEE